MRAAACGRISDGVPPPKKTDADLARAGVNRLSMGVQALDDAALRFLGRDHSAAEALRAVDLARRAFDRLSIDLIYARPDQTPPTWAAELQTALSMGFEHVSPYQLTIEPTTAFGRALARGTLVPPDEDRAAALYETTQAVLSGAGLEMQLPDLPPQRVVMDGPALTFAADIPSSARLLAGPVSDLNVMTRRGVFSHVLLRADHGLPPAAERAGAVTLMLATRPAEAHLAGRRQELGPLDAVICTDALAHLDPGPVAGLWVARISPCLGT